MTNLANKSLPWTITISALASLIWVAVVTGSIRQVPEGSVGIVIKRFSGSHSQNILQPGLKISVPIMEFIKVVRIAPQTVITQPIKGRFREGLTIALQLNIVYVQNNDADTLAKSQTSEVENTIKTAASSAVIDFTASTNSISFAASRDEAASDIAQIMNKNKTLGLSGITITKVTIDRQWLSPELQIIVNSWRSLKDFKKTLEKQSCQDNPAC